MEKLITFLGGVAGAFVVYILMYRDTRISEFLKNPRGKCMLVIVDFFLFLVAGGLVAMFLLSQPTLKDAFIAGVSWQGVVGGLFSSVEYSKLRDQYTTVNSEFTRNMERLEGLRSRIALAIPGEDVDVEQPLQA